MLPAWLIGFISEKPAPVSLRPTANGDWEKRKKPSTRTKCSGGTTRLANLDNMTANIGDVVYRSVLPKPTSYCSTQLSTQLSRLEDVARGRQFRLPSQSDAAHDVLSLICFVAGLRVD